MKIFRDQVFQDILPDNSVQKWIDEFVAEDFVNHNPAFDVTPTNNGLKEMFFENNNLCFRFIFADKGVNQAGLAIVNFVTERSQSVVL